ACGGGSGSSGGEVVEEREAADAGAPAAVSLGTIETTSRKIYRFSGSAGADGYAVVEFEILKATSFQIINEADAVVFSDSLAGPGGQVLLNAESAHRRVTSFEPEILVNTLPFPLNGSAGGLAG